MFILDNKNSELDIQGGQLCFVLEASGSSLVDLYYKKAKGVIYLARTFTCGLVFFLYLEKFSFVLF